MKAERIEADRRLCMVVHASYPLDVRVAREVRVALNEGYEVDVFAMRRDTELKREWHDGAHVFRMPLRHRRGAGALSVLSEYVGFTLFAALRIATRGIARRYDVIQVHNPPDFLMLAAIVPRLLGARVIFDIHDLSPDMFAMRFAKHRGAGLIERLLYSVEAWASHFADAVITVHEPYRRELLSRGVSPKKATVVMNSVDERLLPPESDARPPEQCFRVVYHGTITPSYGVHLLVEAAGHLASDLPDLVVEIYGEGDSVPEIIALSHELRIAERIRVSGSYLPQLDVLERVRLAQVGVIPNLENRLNRYALSSKLFEYVALQIPVVCADLPTMREHFTDEELLFFRPGDSRSLADALLSLARDPAGARARAKAALRRYERDYRWSVNAKRYAAVLNACANSGAEARRRHLSN
jgi:glycosyltransferase involved in cell wall biosynthesis